MPYRSSFEAAFYLNMQYELMKSGKAESIDGNDSMGTFWPDPGKIGRQEYHLLQVNISDQVRSSAIHWFLMCIG